MEKALYYRPDGDDGELIKESDRRRIIKLWGSNPYNNFDTFPIDHNFETGISDVVELMFTIQCDRKLNEREDLIEAKIKQGLNKSKITYKGGSAYKESLELLELIEDARKLFNSEHKENGFEVKNWKLPIREFYRIYGIPYQGIMDKVTKDEQELTDLNIQEPTKIYDVKFHVDHGGDQQTTCKFYRVYGKDIASYSLQLDRPVAIEAYKKFPYLMKVHYENGTFGGKRYDEECVQIYVHDYNRRDWALQNVLHHLKQQGAIKIPD